MPAALWDLDGTLIDSTEYHWRSWVSALGAQGLTVTREQFTATFGQRNDRILRGWLGPDAGGGSDPPHRRRERSRLSAVDARGRPRRSSRRPGLDRSARRAWMAAGDCLLCAAPERRGGARHPRMAWAVHAIVAAEDVPRGKPDPDVFLAAAERVQMPAGACVVVEDAAAGVAAGSRRHDARDRGRARGRRCRPGRGIAERFRR